MKRTFQLKLTLKANLAPSCYYCLQTLTPNTFSCFDALARIQEKAL